MLTTNFPATPCINCTNGSTMGHKGFGTAEIIGGSLGAALGLVVIIITILIVCRRKKSNQRNSSNGNQ